MLQATLQQERQYLPWLPHEIVPPLCAYTSAPWDINGYQWISDIMCQDVSRCVKMCQDVSRCVKMCQDVSSAVGRSDMNSPNSSQAFGCSCLAVLPQGIF